MKPQTPAATRGTWRLGDKIIYDEVLKPYLLNRDKQKTEDEQVEQQLFDTNLEQAKKICEDLFDELNEKGLRMTRLYLRADSVTHFDALFIANREDYLKEEFRDAFVLSNSYGRRYRTDTFFMYSLFIYDAGRLDENAILADGYFMIYDKEQ